MIKKILISDVIRFLKNSEGGVYCLFDQENNLFNVVCDVLDFSNIPIKYIYLNSKLSSDKSSILEYIKANSVSDSAQQCLWNEEYTIYIIPHLDIDAQYIESLINYFASYNSRNPFLLFFNSDNASYYKNSKIYHTISNKFSCVEFSLLSREYILYIIKFLEYKFNVSFDTSNEILIDKIVNILEKFKSNNIYERLKSLMIYYYGSQDVSSDHLIKYLTKDYHELYLSKIFASYYKINREEFLSNVSTINIIEPMLFIRAMMNYTICLLNAILNLGKNGHQKALSSDYLDSYSDKWSQSNIKKVLKTLYIAEKDYKNHSYSSVFFYQKLIIELLIITR